MADEIILTAREARRFLLIKQGLIGEHRFIGKRGALEYVREVGCIQFDPVDVCGKNAVLTLQSRVKGFAANMLDELLYKDRALVDGPDKNLAIWPVEDWPYFSRYREAAREGGRQFEDMRALEDETKAYIRIRGAVTSDELPIEGRTRWHSAVHWSGNWGGETNVARAALEQMYTTGELVIHHKTGARKHYDLAERHLPADLLRAPDPLPDAFEHLKWRVKRRIGAVGLMWDRPSDAWLNIWGMTPDARSEAFRALIGEGKIIAARVEGVRAPLHLRAEDAPLIARAKSGERLRPRCEVLAPLDCMMWDRKLIRALFGFEYAWEIYTPAEKRKYGHYVLPLLCGEGFAGRVEAVANAKSGTLDVKNIWREDGVKPTKALETATEACLRRLARLNGCETVVRADKA